MAVAGSLAMDLSCDFISPSELPETIEPQNHTSNPATIQQSLGGVGRNITTALQYLGVPAQLFSKVGNDIAGIAALGMLDKGGFLTSGIEISPGEGRTAQYVAINNARKELVVAMADMSILQSPCNDQMTNSGRTTWRQGLTATKPKWLVLDANWDSSSLAQWLREGKSIGAKIAYESVSVAKAKRIFAPHTDTDGNTYVGTIPNEAVNLTTPNALELASMFEAAKDAGLLEREDWFRIINSIGLSNAGSRNKLIAMTDETLVDQGVPQQSIQLLPFIPSIVTTLGAQGVLLTQVLGPGDQRLSSATAAPYILSRSTDGNEVLSGVYMRLFRPVEQVPDEDIVSVNGVGDTFLGTLVAGLAKSPSSRIEDLIDIAQRASVLTLRSGEAVSPSISSLSVALTNATGPIKTLT